MMGREHRDIQHTIVAMIAGRVPPRFLHAVRALIDFIYQAQSPVHTDSSIDQMESSLREFHAHKDVIIKVGARRTKAAGSKDDFLTESKERAGVAQSYSTLAISKK